MQYLVLLRAVDTDVPCYTEVTNFRIERDRFRYPNKGSEALLPNNLTRDGKPIVGGLPSKDRCPYAKTTDSLLFQGLRAQVFEE